MIAPLSVSETSSLFSFSPLHHLSHPYLLLCLV
jgi:hypothetical protein